MSDPARTELERYSAQWGADPDLVQGAGGNTSVKRDGQLLIKASGLRLADAERENIFVDVDLSAALAMVDGASAPVTAGALRPSIETSFHAVLPHRYVVHLHAVDVIAFAVRSDGAEALAPLLAGMRWGWVPYRKPGASLAREIATLLRRQGPLDIVVLANHGLIVGADDCRSADRLVRDIRDRLRPTIRQAPVDERDLRRVADRLELEPARIPTAHLAATSSVSLGFAMAGTLYPDHAVFLGRGATRLDAGDERIPDWGESLLHLVPGLGALLPIGAPPEAHEMAGCLGAVASRIAADAKVAPLSDEQTAELLQWDAEHYRQALAQQRRPTHG